MGKTDIFLRFFKFENVFILPSYLINGFVVYSIPG